MRRGSFAPSTPTPRPQRSKIPMMMSTPKHVRGANVQTGSRSVAMKRAAPTPAFNDRCVLLYSFLA